MIYIDPSELRSNSRFLKCLEDNPDFFGDDSRWQPVTDLEQMTGADVMISPQKGPFPDNETRMRLHIRKGAILVQLKFGHDFIASLLDGRYKEAQSRMKLIGAAPWQRVCFLVGLFYVDADGDICANHRKSVDVIGGKAKNINKRSLNKAKWAWNFRGGFLPDVHASEVVEYLLAGEETLMTCIDNPQRYVFPQGPVLLEKELGAFDNKDWIDREWQELQKLNLVTDWRRMLMTLPGIGEVKAREIGERYTSWLHFEQAVLAKTVEIKGIGQKSIEKIRKFIGG